MLTVQKDVERSTRKVGAVELFDRLQYIYRFGGVHSVHWTSSAGTKMRRTARESHRKWPLDLSSRANEVRAFRTVFLFDVFDLIGVETYENMYVTREWNVARKG